MDTGVDHGAFAPSSLAPTAVEIQGGADTSSAVRHAAESVKSIAGSADEAIDAARCAPGEGRACATHLRSRVSLCSTFMNGHLSAPLARGRGIVVEARTAMHR